MAGIGPYTHTGTKASFPANTARKDATAKAGSLPKPDPKHTKMAPKEPKNPGGLVKGPSPGKGFGGNGPNKRVGDGTRAPKNTSSQAPKKKPGPDHAMGKIRKDFTPLKKRFNPETTLF